MSVGVRGMVCGGGENREGAKEGEDSGEEWEGRGGRITQREQKGDGGTQRRGARIFGGIGRIGSGLAR